jgi:NitT/TauT family transport system substrate-binding protein
MVRNRWRGIVVFLMAISLVAAACGGDDGGGGGDGGGGDDGEPDQITLQLKWVTQAQFAGYYAAQDQGYYADEGLDVEILVGGPDITPEQVVAGGAADIGINWFSSTLVQRDQGVDIVNIAQVFTRSGITEIAFKDSGITSFEDMAGKRVGVWCCGNQYQQFAALTKAGIDPDDPSQVTIVDQPFTMDLFLNREVDAASAMTYNELAQVLEVTGDGGEFPLYTLDDLNVLPLAELGTAMLEDGVFVRGDWIADETNKDIAARFLKASFRGWIYCRDNFEACLDIVLAAGPTLGEGHQRWQLNEINALIWPAPLGIGIMDPELFAITNDIASTYELIGAPATEDSFDTTLAELAVQDLIDEGVDVNGNDYQKLDVEVTANGE